MFPFYVNVRQKKKQQKIKGVVYMQTGISWVSNDKITVTSGFIESK